MKVLHLIGGGDVGGAKIHIFSLLQELKKHIDVKLVCLRPGAFFDESQKLGIDTEVIKSSNIFKDIKNIISIINNGYDVVHSHGAKANMIAVTCKPFIKAPLVTTMHSDYRLDYMQSFFKALTFGNINSAALRFIDYYVAVSNNFKKMLESRHFDSKRIFTVYNGMNLQDDHIIYSKSDFLKKHNIKWNEHDIFIGILARLHPVKNISTFLKAAKEVIKVNPSVKFLIGGDGEERKKLESETIHYKINDNVHFLGFINENPLEFMNAIDINVLTSLSESFPYTILEGVKLKKATVSSNVGGIPDLIEHNENGYLFKVGDHEQLAKYLLNLINDNELRIKFGEKINKKAVEHFSLESMAKTQVKIYTNVLKSHKEKKTKLASTTKKKYDFLISGYYGFGNVGDEAILSAIISDIRKVKPDAKIAVMSIDPKTTEKTHNIDSVNRLVLSKILSYMNNSKVLISGGGSLIQDINSTRSLMYYLSIIFFAKVMQMKIVLYANSIGPVKKNLNRKIAKFILNKVDVITLREPSSKTELELLDVSKPDVYVTADPVLSLTSSPEEEINRIFEKENLSPVGSYVGFSIRKWGSSESYQIEIAKIADYLIETYNYTPIFIPMHCPDDFDISESIISHMKGTAYLLSQNYPAEILIGMIKKMHLVVGMRLHSLIFAASASIPFVAIEYEKKIGTFLDYIGQKDVSYAGHINEISFEKLKKTIADVLSDKNAISKKLQDKMLELRSKSLENAIIAVSELNEKDIGEVFVDEKN